MVRRCASGSSWASRPSRAWAEGGFSEPHVGCQDQENFRPGAHLISLGAIGWCSTGGPPWPRLGGHRCARPGMAPTPETMMRWPGSVRVHRQGHPGRILARTHPAARSRDLPVRLRRDGSVSVVSLRYGIVPLAAAVAAPGPPLEPGLAAARTLAGTQGQPGGHPPCPRA